MDYLYAPWRSEYVTSKKIEGCVFCHIVNNPDKDEELFVLYRDEFCFMVMNRYPYNPGHFMIIPNKHTDAIENLDEKVWLRISSLARKSVKMMKEGFGAKGVNIGMNLGQCAGAGIAEHVHMHIVPRWDRDTNFITTIAKTRVYSTEFTEVYKKIKAMLPKFIGE